MSQKTNKQKTPHTYTDTHKKTLRRAQLKGKQGNQAKILKRDKYRQRYFKNYK